MRSFHLFALAVFGLLASVSSCSVLVDTSGLVGSGTDAGDAQSIAGDSGAVNDASVAADTGSGASDAARDADATSASDAGDSGGGDADAPSCAPPSRVQFAHLVNDTDAGTAIAVALTDTSLRGDYIVVGINYSPACGAVANVTDTAGNTYKSIIPSDSNGGALALETWGAVNVVPSAQNVVTVAFLSGCSAQNVKVAEYTGIDPASPVLDTVSMHGGPEAPDASLTAIGPAFLFAHTADSSECLGPGPGWAQIIIDEWATLAEQNAAPEGGVLSVSEMPRNDDAWVIQAVALRTCQ